MQLLQVLQNRHQQNTQPFFIQGGKSIYFLDIESELGVELSSINSGDVVALIGDFDALSIQTFIRLIDLSVALVPLTTETRGEHDYFFDAAHADVVIEGRSVKRIRPRQSDHPMLKDLRRRDHAGLVLFSSGTTGKPKAILHDMDQFLARYKTARPSLRTLNFLLFDHIGGLNTLMHTLFNCGVVVIPASRTPERIRQDIEEHQIELLPTTPSFLRWMLIGGFLDKPLPPSLEIVTYGTERMDQTTLDQLADKCPNIDFRQTYGMSELGILRVKSRARDSLWMKVGGEGVEIAVDDAGVLKIKSKNKMVGYLNASSPFDKKGWYDTGDLVEQDGEWLKITGRTNDVINVGGLKVLPAEIERVALSFPGVLYAKAEGISNPILGQHIELKCQASNGVEFEKKKLKIFLKDNLNPNLVPHRIRVGDVEISHRFKKL